MVAKKIRFPKDIALTIRLRENLDRDFVSLENKLKTHLKSVTNARLKNELKLALKKCTRSIKAIGYGGFIHKGR